MALALAARRAGHRIVGVLGRNPDRTEAAAQTVGARPLFSSDLIGTGDLLVLAVRDAVIEDVAAAVGDASGYTSAIHLSGYVSVDALQLLASQGLECGSFHPLQTLPTPEAGVCRLSGAWIGVTAVDPLRSTLHKLAASLGARPFDLADDSKALYHAAASAAANFPLSALVIAQDLFKEVGVPLEAAKPLVMAVIENAFDMGATAALTGPVARGDMETVNGQIRAVNTSAPEWSASFVTFVRQLARIVGRSDQFKEIAGS